MELKKIINEFEKTTGYKLEIKDNKLFYNGNLNLRETHVTELPDNLTVGGSLDLRDTPITSLPQNLTVGGNLNLSRTKITSLPNNLTVGGGLNLYRTDITELPEGLTVGGYLDLTDTPITSLPQNLTVGGNLNLYRTEITSLPNNLTVAGYLDLSYTPITSLPDNLKVGGSLYLYKTKITKLPKGLTVRGNLDLFGTDITTLPDNLVVGGDLDLRATPITALPEGLTVKGNLWLSGIEVKDTSNIKRTLSEDAKRKINEKQNMCLTWERKNKTYIKVDGFFSIIDSHHENVWKVHQIGSNKNIFIVTDGEYHYAHGETIEEAKKDLIYKICNRDKSEYKHLTLESVLTFEQAVECYRVITGACAAGTRNFCENVMPEENKKNKYTIREIIHLTENQYGNNIFKTFFEK